jgi:hypothetical protein
MRIDIYGLPTPSGDALRSRAQTRLWLATQRHAHRLAWVSALFTEHNGEGEMPRTTCKIVASLRHCGSIDIQHTNIDPSIALDLACARFEQALVRLAPEVMAVEMGEPTQWETPA